MASVCIIPARGGSKRIPRKNIREFCGKPIIAWSIETALNSGLFDEVIVSTDDLEIANVAKLHGAVVPFLRSPENSNDFAGTEEVILEVINEYSKLGSLFDYACCIYPTAPFLKVNDLVKAFEKLKADNRNTVFPVVRFSYPILRALFIENEKLKMEWPENENKRSQDFKTYYHDAGQFYWVDVERFKNSPNLFSNNTGYIEMDENSVQDIDNLSDWEVAEFKFRYLLSRQNAG